MILGDDTKPAQLLYVGAGDTVARLIERNSYLQPLKLSDQEELRLPLMTKLDVHYDDGEMKLDVGCALTTNIDGNERFHGAAFIGIKLCERSLNDWRPALRKAAEIMHRLGRKIRRYRIYAIFTSCQRKGVAKSWGKYLAEINARHRHTYNT